MAFSVLGILSVLLEFFRPWLWIIGVVIAVDLVLYLLVLFNRGGTQRAALRPAALLGLVVGGAAAVFAPLWTQAEFGHLNPVLDYAAVAGIGLGAAIVATIIVFPVIRLMAARD